MLEEQNGVCAICRCKEKIINKNGKKWLLAIDHNHKTGKIRGLLCNSCNIGLGRFNEDIKLLKKAIEYLRREL